MQQPSQLILLFFFAFTGQDGSVAGSSRDARVVESFRRDG
jgi:hypothetical protein